MAVHILGIRHHGPGSARNVKQFLEQLQPDLVLVEGPPEADSILEWVTHSELKPPVAILCFQPDNPQKSCFYPFAEFSPEWQAILYARTNKIPVKFMDLPSAHQFAIEQQESKEEETKEEEENKTEEAEDNTSINNEIVVGTELSEEIVIRRDPISYLADVAGFSDGEKWWEQMFEHRLQNEEVFDAVYEAMDVLREHHPSKEQKLEQLREAWMRKTIRQAEREMYQNIAVICGAWHAPALKQMPKQKEDNDLLKGLPKVKTECTWVPWTYNRLSYYTGYGAGIVSPGWYEHIWNYPADDGTRWMAKVAKLFRAQQMDTSVAHVIEAVRLAESLASLRGLSKAGLEELNEATLSVVCNGEAVRMDLVWRDLIVSDKIGEVPAESPKPPLQMDIEKLQKRLRLPATADWKDFTLDLRKEMDLERSVFLHRLQLLGIAWGQQSATTGKGTFKEQWRLQWQPEFSIHIIEKGNWGNTVEEATDKYVINKANESAQLIEVCSLLEHTIPAELPNAVDQLIQKINNLAATGSDVLQLMQVIPGLVSITRYGNVRKTDEALVLEIVESMITRVCISLPAASTGIADDAAMILLESFVQINDAVSLLQHVDSTQQWLQAIRIISTSKQSSPVLAGYAKRLLVDHKLIQGDELVQQFFYAMSPATAPSIVAAWLEGFLKGSGTILLIDQDLWSVVNNWVETLTEEVFIDVLPLLRRTFAAFSKPERRRLGEKVRTGSSGSISTKAINDFDEERGMKGIPVVMQMLGYPSTTNLNG
jgi:hypothetical protein